VRKAQAGFTLVETIVAAAVMAILGGVSADLIRSLSETRRSGNALVRDVQDVKRLVDALERDVRAGESLAALGWKLDGSSVLRSGRVLARNVAAFTYEEEGGRARIEFRLARRGRSPVRPDPSIALLLYRRGSSPP
jgi:prepilin-type N-terminal cleavage/methylation domain-containing protein